MHSSDGATAFQPSEIASILNDQFVSNSTNSDASPIPPPSLPFISPIIKDLKITRQTVLQQLKQLDISKAVGPDGIPNIILKNAPTNLPTPLHSSSVNPFVLTSFPVTGK